MKTAKPERLAWQSPPSGRSIPPYSIVIGVAVGALLVHVAMGPLHDVDLYWHLLAGRELTDGVPVDSIGQAWSFAPDRSVLPWTTSQWLSEIIFLALHNLSSWSGLAAFRVVTAATALAILGVTTLRGRPRSIAAFPFLVAGLTVALMSQERPQQFSFIGAALMGGVLAAGIDGARPRTLALAVGTVVWANLHGGWILVPATLLLIAAARLVDHGPRDGALRQAALAALATLAAGALTPALFGGLTTAIRLARSTEHLIEWQPTQPFTVPGAVTVAMLALLILGWSRPAHTLRSEYFACFVLLLFSWTAWRNMAPALLMLAPLVAERLSQAFPRARGGTEPSWSVPAGVAAACLGLIIGLASIGGRQHLPLATWPIALADDLQAAQEPARVLTDYNVSGIALYFGGPAVATSIDGRADRYRPEYVEAHDDLMDLKGEWRQLLVELAPTAALIRRDSALNHELQNHRGWRLAGVDGDFVLLEPAGRPPDPGQDRR